MICRESINVIDFVGNVMQKWLFGLFKAAKFTKELLGFICLKVLE